MNANRTILAVALGAAIAVGLASYSLLLPASQAAQGQGTLSQAPLNLGGGVDPAFIMAVDDSGSMNFEILVANQNGELIWGRDDRWSEYGFFEDDGSLRDGGDYRIHDYLELFPFPGRLTKRKAVPPTSNFGFARSPDFNPAYFDPSVSYDPWKNHDGTSWESMDTEAEWKAVKVDPRNGSSVSGSWNGTPFNLLDNEARVTELNDPDDWETEWMFDYRYGMVIPQGTRYFEYDNCDGVDGSRRQWRTADRDITITDDGSCRIAIRYFAATYYLTTATSADGSSGVEVVNQAGGPRSGKLYRYEIKSGNYSGDSNGDGKDDYHAAMTNFANWFTYYRSRNLAMVAAMTNSFDDVEKMRVGYFTINGSLPDVTMQDMARAQPDGSGDYPADYNRDDLYEDMLKLEANGGTPNRLAVEHIGDQFTRTDDDAPVQNACQVNAGMLFTDGYSNEGFANAGEHDAGVASMFGSSASNTMADTAAKYYLMNLRSGNDWEDQVRVPSECEADPNDKSLDCRNDPHMNFYGITLGALGDRYGTAPYVNTTDEPDGARVAAIANNPDWIVPEDDQPSAIDEIWHATLNARGKFVNASSPAAVTAAMREILASVGDGGGPSGSIGVTGARLGGNSLAITPEFTADGTEWSGDLQAERVALSATGDIEYEAFWRASDELPGPAERNLFFAATTSADPTPETPAVLEFSADNLGADEAERLRALCSGYNVGTCSNGGTRTLAQLGVTADQAVAYLRGDQSMENTLRRRGEVIGDIINSSPVVSSPRDNYGYTALRGSDATESDPYGYGAYLTAKQNRPTMVYVGANDGMLHGFLGMRESSTGNEGREEFGYIPATALGYMGNLLMPESPFFQHRYLVDGPIAVSDARFSANDWRTVLVGTAGAGGRSVFGLDVSNATSFDANDVLWEINDQVGGAVGARIGHVLGKPLVVPVMTSGGDVSWKAIFGNGYDSSIGADGTVTLFVVDIATGNAEYIDAVEDGGPNVPNGLGNIVALDRYLVNGGSFEDGSDGFVDTVYGGDLHGNVWKFDLRDNTVAFDGVPFFTATDGAGKRQAITGGLEAALGPYNGVMVLFGTGSFSFDGDKQNTDIQSVYGILDKGDDEPITGARSTVLQQQALTGGEISTRNPVNYFSRSGWFMDLGVVAADGSMARTGERMVGYPRLQGGTFFFPTYEPGSTDICAGGGNDWVYGLSALTGAADLSSLRMDTPDGSQKADGTGRVKLNSADATAVNRMPVKDIAVFASSPLAGGTLEERLGQQCDIIIQASGAKPMYRWRACGRQSWRQVR
ncbi:PilC/PilY family type IV pilus protein [Lysobacter sp. F6437]|uniref:PilC/PilY family type IV pilus protein n=1 Tax=Lysobacter sp. F6437 TaxID=3459296 RepID=UPI00403D5986